MSDKMSDMAGTSRVSIRELQKDLKRVLARVERGGVIEVTRHGRAVARLSPARASAPQSPWPDLEARARSVFGRRTVDSPSPSDVIVESRGER
jgi:prevent-host-death family protein